MLCYVMLCYVYMYESYPRSSKKLHLPPREHPEDLDHNLVLLAVEIIRDINLALSKAPPKDHQLQKIEGQRL